LDVLYNRQGNRLTFAWPIAREVAYLFDRFGWVDRVLTLIAWLVAVVAAGAILASIYKSMSARRRELAILRALGARRSTVFAAIVAEAGAVAVLGIFPGFVFHGVILGIASAIIRAQTGVVLDPFALDPVLLWAPVALVTLSALAGIIPAIKAYRVDVSGGLAPES
jgi:putative ABC transport system permease protein